MSTQPVDTITLELYTDYEYILITMQVKIFEYDQITIISLIKIKDYDSKYGYILFVIDYLRPTYDL